LRGLDFAGRGSITFGGEKARTRGDHKSLLYRGGGCQREGAETGCKVLLEEKSGLGQRAPQ